MKQLSIDDFLQSSFPDPNLLIRLSALFSGWEVVGCISVYCWSQKDDYTVMIWNGNRYHLVTATICQDGKDYAGYIERDDFEPSWFDSKKGKEWVWISLDHKNGVIDTAQKNIGRFERIFRYQRK